MYIWVSVSQVPFLLSRNLKCRVFKERLQMRRFMESLVVWGLGSVNAPGRDVVSELFQELMGSC